MLKFKCNCSHSSAPFAFFCISVKCIVLKKCYTWNCDFAASEVTQSMGGYKKSFRAVQIVLLHLLPVKKKPESEFLPESKHAVELMHTKQSTLKHSKCECYYFQFNTNKYTYGK